MKWRQPALAIAAWLLTSAAGAALIVLLPEDLLGSGRMFSLSTGHGPSASDAIGVAVILAGWGWFVREVWRSRPAPWPGLALVALALAAIAGCLAAISADRNALGLLAGAIAVAAQIALALLPHCLGGKEGK